MKVFFLLMIIIFCVNTSFGQKLRFEYSAWTGAKFYEGETEVTEELFIHKLESDSSAAKFISNHTLKGVVTLTGVVAGGGLIGWSLGELSSGKNPEMWMLGLGTVFSIGAIVTENSMAKDVQLAVAEYNKTH